MPKLTDKERCSFEKILGQDLGAINQKFMNQIKDFWAIARKEILRRKGHDKLMEEKEKLKHQISEIQSRIHEIEEELRSQSLKPEQIVELGGKPDDYGRFKGATFYDIPVESQFEYEIVEYIRKNINIEIPAKILRDVCEASMRELAMSGTFEEARNAYEKFYSLDFRKYGVDIPPRLDEISKNKALLDCARSSLKQIEDKTEGEAEHNDS